MPPAYTASPIGEYLDLLHDRVEAENTPVNIWAPPSSPHLTDELLVEADRLWQRAEELAAGDPAVLGRVKLSRMSVDYAILARAQAALDAERLGLIAARCFEPFFDTLATSGLTRIREWTVLDAADFRKKTAQALGMED